MDCNNILYFFFILILFFIILFFSFQIHPLCYVDYEIGNYFYFFFIWFLRLTCHQIGARIHEKGFDMVVCKELKVRGSKLKKKKYIACLLCFMRKKRSIISITETHLVIYFHAQVNKK